MDVRYEFDVPAPPTQRGTAALANFSAHVYRGQMAAWIRMPRGMQIGRCWVRLYSVHAALTLTLHTEVLHF